MTVAQIDPKKSEAFAEKLIGVTNGAALALMLSIGHRTGLLDVMDGAPPLQSAAIAERAGLQERYVRECLGALVTGGVVEYEPATAEYWLPPEHAAWLTRRAGPENLAVGMQFIAVLGGVEDDIVRCFTEGGGVPYSSYPRFHEVMAEESAQTIVAALEEHILPLAPGVIERLERGIDVLDVGCGRGRAMLRLGAAFPNSRFVGYDISHETIEAARREASAAGLDNVTFAVQDAAAFDDIAAFDLITSFDAIHDQAAPDRMLACIHRALRPDGLYLAQDIRTSSQLEKNTEHPLAPFLFTISCMHCMTVSLAADGAGLGACWGEEVAVEMLAAAGFSDVRIERLPHDIMNNYYLSRP